MREAPRNKKNKNIKKILLFHVLPCSLPYCCVWWIRSSIVITLWTNGLIALLYFGLGLVYCLSWIFCSSCSCHYENTPIQIYWIFYHKKWRFSDKNSDIFHNSAQNIDCGYSLEPPRRGGFNEYPQSMFLNRNKRNNVYPCKPQFYYIKVGFTGVKII